MATQHTAGPWFVAEDDGNGQAVVRNKGIEVATCWHHCVGEIEREMRANAQLIAASPDLLSASAAWVAYLDDPDGPEDDATENALLDAIRDAVARAVS